MSESKSSSAIRNFVPRKIRSVEQLEILLLLGRARHVIWTARSVYDTILSSHRSVQVWLDELVRGGFAEKVTSPSTGYRSTSDEQKAAIFDALEQAYRTTPVRVVESVFQRDSTIQAATSPRKDIVRSRHEANRR